MSIAEFRYNRSALLSKQKILLTISRGLYDT